MSPSSLRHVWNHAWYRSLLVAECQNMGSKITCVNLHAVVTIYFSQNFFQDGVTASGGIDNKFQKKKTRRRKIRYSRKIPTISWLCRNRVFGFGGESVGRREGNMFLIAAFLIFHSFPLAPTSAKIMIFSIILYQSAHEAHLNRNMCGFYFELISPRDMRHFVPPSVIFSLLCLLLTSITFEKIC